MAGLQQKVVDCVSHYMQIKLLDLSGPALNVVAKHIREASVGGATFEMSCTVDTENLVDVGYSVLVQSQDSLESNVRTIMTLSPDSVLQHGGATDPNRRCTPASIRTSTHGRFSGVPFILTCPHVCLCPLRESLVLTKSGPAEFRFRLVGVQLSDRGYYWCDITAWTKQQPGHAWTRATSAESNKVRVDFQENGGSSLGWLYSLPGGLRLESICL